MRDCYKKALQVNAWQGMHKLLGLLSECITPATEAIAVSVGRSTLK